MIYKILLVLLMGNIYSANNHEDHAHDQGRPCREGRRRKSCFCHPTTPPPIEIKEVPIDKGSCGKSHCLCHPITPPPIESNDRVNSTNEMGKQSTVIPDALKNTKSHEVLPPTIQITRSSGFEKVQESTNFTVLNGNSSHIKNDNPETNTSETNKIVYLQKKPDIATDNISTETMTETMNVKKNKKIDPNSYVNFVQKKNNPLLPIKFDEYIEAEIGVTSGFRPKEDFVELLRTKAQNKIFKKNNDEKFGDDLEYDDIELENENEEDEDDAENIKNKHLNPKKKKKSFGLLNYRKNRKKEFNCST